MKIDDLLNTSVAISHGKLQRIKSDGPWVCSWVFSWIYFIRTNGDKNPLVSYTLENFIMLGLENCLFSSMISQEFPACPAGHIWWHQRVVLNVPFISRPYLPLYRHRIPISSHTFSVFIHVKSGISSGKHRIFMQLNPLKKQKCHGLSPVKSCFPLAS